MQRRKTTKEQLEKNKKNQKIIIKANKAARRSGKITKTEGKVGKSKSKKNLKISQKRTATIKKSRY